MHYARRRETATRGHGVTPAKLQTIKQALARHPRGSVVDRDGRLLMAGDGTLYSGQRKLHGYVLRGDGVIPGVETRTGRATLTPAQQAVVARAERTLASRPADRLAAARRKAEKVKAAATAHLYHED